MNTPLLRYDKQSYTRFILYSFFALVVLRISIDYLGLFVKLHIPLLGTLSLSQLFALFIMPLMFYFFLAHFSHVTKTPFLLPFLLIIAIDLITVPFSPLPNVRLALYEVLRIASIIFLYVLSYTLITTRKRFHMLIMVIVTASWIPLLFALGQFLLGIGYNDVAFHELRIFGSFTHPNVYGTYLLVIITALLINIVMRPERWIRLYSFALLGLNFFALTLTFTRIAWLMGILIIGLFLTVKNRIFAITFFLLILLAYMGIPQIHERLHEATTLSPDSSLVWRFNLWHDTIFYTTSNGDALLGNGTGTFMDVADIIRGDLFGDHEPHNEFVRAYVENGLLGLGAYIFYLLMILTITIRKTFTTPSRKGRNVFFLLSVLFIALTIASLTDHIFRSTPLQWTFMALLGGALATFSPTSHRAMLHLRDDVPRDRGIRENLIQ